ncbi:hypothetical protein GQ44DRAFT_558139, partial [Phaeosphaeriaceae sp. PMI808]
MAKFLDLPRELRDMIYMAIITWERPRPALEDATSMLGWIPSWETQNRDGPGCIFSSKKAPSTCANVLVANRQVNEEMGHNIDRARRKGALRSRMDCIARKNGQLFYFSWLSIPIVHTRIADVHDAKNIVRSRWAPSVPVVRRLWAAAPRWPSTIGCRASTSIEQLQIDIRFFQNDRYRQSQIEGTPDRASWAICAALKTV